MKSKSILDTNILIRFLTGDPLDQAKLVKNLFSKAKRKSLIIPDVILVESVFVLLSLYNLPKSEVIEMVSALIVYEKFDLHTVLFQKTLEIFSKYPISFVDAYICAMNITAPDKMVYTFDKRILTIEEVNSQKPE
ncbi:MAG: PIN domain-containing protein [bacterium]